jgi:L-lactate permease
MPNDAPSPEQLEHPEQSLGVVGCAVLFGAFLGGLVGLGMAYALFHLLLHAVGLDYKDCLDCFLVTVVPLSVLGAAVGAWLTWRRPFPPKDSL